MVKSKEKDGWEFLFIGANIDSVETAGSFGIRSDRAVNYHADAAGTALNYAAVSEAICCVRESRPLSAKWKAAIEEDYDRRK